MSRIQTALLRSGATVGACALLTLAPVLHAANWQSVVSGKAETIEIDKSRIARGTSGTTAWSRIKLGQSVPDQAGAYNTIEAQNLYNCESGSFTTLRRVYFNGATQVREEAVTRKRANQAEVGSIDARLLNEACRLRTVGEAQRVAEEAALAMQTAQQQSPGSERPSPMHADMRTLAGNSAARIIPVADAGHGAERPKMIQLPPIDKAAAEAAASGISTKPAAKPAPPIAPVAPAAASHGAPVVAKTAEPRLVPRAVEIAAAAENRHTRELILATSGPKKAAARSAKKADSNENPAQNMHAHWGYDGAGAPANWGKMKPEYATCDIGKRQSPIDIRDGIKVDLEGVRFDYRLTKFTIVDNGHTVQVNVGAGSAIHVMGKRYELVQFHFHKPSEERVFGRPFDMVIHFVHKDYDDNLAVIAVLLETGAENPQIQTLWNNMPLEANQELSPSDVLDPMRLMPENRTYWTYMGSLTTPPCTENVLWMVMKQPQQVSPEQIAIFARLYRNNARPVQPANGRLVKESR
jgi:carbonic anhydrase